MPSVPVMPIPVDGPVSPLLTVALALGAVAVFAVIVWQAVRYFRDDRNDRDGPSNGDDDQNPFR